MTTKVIINRLATGVTGLDEVLGGGLPEFSFNLIAGQPGCGKTTLAHQIMFALATPERSAIYFTVLGEPPLKMLRYQQQFDFFDSEAIDRSVRFINLSDDAMAGDLDRVLKRIVEEVTQHNPALVFVDSFRSVVLASETDGKPSGGLQQFVQQLGMLMTSWQATTFLIGEYFSETDANPVFTVSDGLIWLRQSVQRNSMVRKMEIMKMRGQPSLPGLHTFRIARSGVEVFPPPNVVVPATAHADAALLAPRMSMGVPGLDEMLGGGLPRGYSLLVAGPSGSGKSILAAQFLSEGARNRETGVIAAFEQHPNRSRSRVVADLIASGRVALVENRSSDLSIDEIVFMLMREIRRLGASRVVIDSLSGFELALAPTFREDFRESLSNLVTALAGAGVTVLMTSELEDRYTDLRFSPYGTAFMTDAIIVQRYIEVDSRLLRVMAVVKVRASAHSDQLREFSINDNGIHIGKMLADQEGLLGGRPTQKNSPALRASGADAGVEGGWYSNAVTLNHMSPSSEDLAETREKELARLDGRIASMRAVLVRLLQDVVQAESRLDSSQSLQLLEANEQLVVTAMRAQIDADTSAQALDEASRSTGLDPLTDLPTRALMLDRFGHAIANAKRRGTRVGLLFLDLNSFKEINDTFGHAAGDEALKVVARCLVSSVRETDTVSRHGGDEFVILLAEVAQPADAVHVAEKVMALLRATRQIEEHQIALTASIGISLYPDDGDNPRMLIDRADAAMYLAKRYEQGGYVFHGERPSGDSGPRSLPLESQQQRLAHYEREMVDHERRLAQLREANEQLVLASLGAQELQAASEQIQKRQAEFLAVVADELNNPHAPIRVATAMLGRARNDEPLLPRARAIIDRQVQRMARMVNDVLDPARVRSRRSNSAARVVDMADIVEEAVRIHGPEMHRRHQTLVVDIPPGPLDVLGDAARLAQVLGNLLINATTYAQEGGRIRLSIVVESGKLLVTVADRGIGIAPEALQTIFEPFMQDTHAVGLNGVGVGIGLTVVREIVMAHGGSVAAYSAGHGLGSEFVITLPTVAVPAA